MFQGLMKPSRFTSSPFTAHTCSPQDGATPVFIAAHNNHVAALELLIKANADVNKATQVRESAMLNR